MLAQVNLLYLGTGVLILLDLSYLRRFWMQFEAWLSMQQATTGKLCRAASDRGAISHLQWHADRGETTLEQWQNVSQSGHGGPRQPDVTVTNQRTRRRRSRLGIFAENVKVNTGGFKLVMTIERAVGKKPRGGRGRRSGWMRSWRGKLDGGNGLIVGRSGRRQLHRG